MTDLGREMHPLLNLVLLRLVASLFPGMQGRRGGGSWQMGAVEVSCQVEGAANTRHRLWAASLGLAGMQTSKHLRTAMLCGRGRVVGRE